MSRITRKSPPINQSDFASIRPLTRPNNNIVVGLGSSVTTWGSNDSSHRPAIYDNMLGHLCVESMQQMRFGGVIGHGGWTQPQVITDFLPTILAMNPAPGACLYFDTPFNDMCATGLSFAETKANWLTIINALLAKGIVPIVGTVPHHSYGDTFFPILAQWNRWVRRYAATNGLPLVDFATALADVNGDYLTQYVSDEVHPNSLGHKAVAQQALADGLADYFTPAGTVLTSKYLNDPSTLIIDSGINTGLFSSDGNADGLADGWSYNGGAANTCSLVTPDASDRLVGKWQRVSWKNGDAATWVAKSITTGYSTGDILAVSARIRTAGVEAATGAWTVGFQQYFSGGYTYPAPGSGPGNVANYVPAGCSVWSTDVDDGLMYAEFPILAGATLSYLTIQLGGYGTGTATLDVGEYTLVNLTTGALL